jgi:hypothetical protein
VELLGADLGAEARSDRMPGDGGWGVGDGHSVSWMAGGGRSYGR